MTHKALTTPVSGTPDDLTASFNAEAKKTCEIEMKFIVPSNEDDTVNHAVFDSVKKFFADLNWIKIQKENNRIVTRQADTVDRALLQAGNTLRLRGGCEDGNIHNISSVDICLKTSKTLDKSDAMRRGEYQTGTDDFEHFVLDKLRTAYPQEKYPEVYKALEGIKDSQLREFFRIDCIRHRYVLDVPAEVVGLDGGKKFAAELLLDDNAFVLDVPGLDYPLVFHHDLEIECESLFKQCEFDSSPYAAKYISSDLNEEETDRAMAAMRDKIQEAAGGGLIINFMSKAERGFKYLDETLERLRDYVEANKRLTRNNTVQSAFTVSASGVPANDNEKLHYFLNRDFGPILRERGIARYNPV